VMRGSTRTKSTDCMTMMITRCANRSDGNLNGASFPGKLRISKVPPDFQKAE
jgi:hypothetical protein